MGELERRLEEKISLLRHLLAETSRVAELLDQDALEELTRCIQIRQGYIDRMDELERQWKADGAYTAFRATAAGKKHEADVMALLRAIQEKDAENIRLVVDRKSEIANQIRGANMGKHLQAYGKPSTRQSRFINRKG